MEAWCAKVLTRMIQVRLLVLESVVLHSMGFLALFQMDLRFEPNIVPPVGHWPRAGVLAIMQIGECKVQDGLSTYRRQGDIHRNSLPGVFDARPLSQCPSQRHVAGKIGSESFEFLAPAISFMFKGHVSLIAQLFASKQFDVLKGFRRRRVEPAVIYVMDVFYDCLVAAVVLVHALHRVYGHLLTEELATVPVEATGPEVLSGYSKTMDRLGHDFSRRQERRIKALHLKRAFLNTGRVSAGSDDAGPGDARAMADTDDSDRFGLHCDLLWLAVAILGQCEPASLTYMQYCARVLQPDSFNWFSGFKFKALAAMTDPAKAAPQ